MSNFADFTDEYLNKKKKKNGVTPNTDKKESLSFSDFTDSYLGNDTSDDIAPVRQTETTKKEKKWYQKIFKGSDAFDDGYQFGDVLKTLDATARDLSVGVKTGVLGMGEAAIDFGATIAGGVGGFFGADEFQDKMAKFVAKDIINEREVAKNLDMINGGFVTEMISGGTYYENLEENSVAGDTLDSWAESGGQLLGTAALQYVGIPWYVTSGVISFGREAENAFRQGASYGEAVLSATIAAGVEVGTEKLFGGSGLGEKGLFNTDVITKGISNKVGKMVADIGVDMTAEGLEEVFSSIGSAVGQKLSYASEKEWNEILSSEDLFEAFVGGAILSGFANAGKVSNSAKTGRDYRTGLTENEQKVFDKVYEDAIAEATEGGKELTKKQKAEIYDEVMKSLQRGEVDTDTIESILGGEEYKAYKDTIEGEESLVNQKEALQEEFDALNKMKLGERTGEQTDRLEEVRGQIKELNRQIATNQRNGKSDQLKSQLSKNVQSQLVRQDGKKTLTDDYLIESYNEKARRQQKFEVDLSKYEGKTKEILENLVKKGQINNARSTHEFWEYAAKAVAERGGNLMSATTEEILEMERQKHGNEYVEKNFDGKTPPNAFVMDDGTIVINVKSRAARTFLLGHEIMHTLEKAKNYDRIKDLLLEYDKTKTTEADQESRQKATKERYEGIKGAEADKEFVADLVGKYIYGDTDFIHHLSTADQNLFQKIWDKVKYLYKMATAGSQEQRDLLRIEREFEKAYRENIKGKAETKTDGDAKFSLSDSEKIKVTPEEDSAYMDAYFDGEDDLMQEMVDKVAERLGYKYKAYHHTENAFTVFDLNKARKSMDIQGFFFSADKNAESEYGSVRYDTYLKMDNPYIVDSKEKQKAIPFDMSKENAGVIAREWLQSQGYDGVIRKAEYFGAEADEYIVFDSSQIKSSEPMTFRDDEYGEGDVIPLSERFNEKNADIRYSLSDSDGKQLTKEQSDYFKDSKMRDENGNLKVMYHGSQNAGFHVFDPSHSDDDTSLFFVDRNDVAASYSGTTETYEAQTIRTAEDMNNFLAKIGYDHYQAVERNGKFELLENNEHVAYSDTAKGIYEEFCWYEGVGEGDANYKVYLNLTNPLEVDAEGRNWNNVTREFSQEVADRYNSLTAEEKEALLQLASWEDIGMFRDGFNKALVDLESGFYPDEYSKNLARAFNKLGGYDANVYDIFSVASDNFSEESIKEFAVKQMNTRDYAQKAKAGGYDGVIFKNLIDNGGYSNGSEGASTVAIAFDSNQIKSVANENPTGDADIRYSISTENTPMAKTKDSFDPTKANLQKDLKTVRAVRTETMLKNGYKAEDVEEVNHFMDNLATFMEKAGVTYKFIGLEDVNNAKLKVTYDKNGNPKKITMSAMVKNGEYPVNFDFTRICKKRESMSMVIKELAKRKTADGRRTIDTINLDAEALWTINEELREAGLETACLGCFVESKRYNIQAFADKAVKMWNTIVDEVRQENGVVGEASSFNFAEGINLDRVDYGAIEKIFADYNTVKGRTSPEARMRALIRNGGELYQRYLQPSDLMTPEGIEAIKAMSTKKNDFYGILKGVYGQAAPKEVAGFSPYNSEVALLPKKKNGKALSEYVASIGGVRMQSFSDFLVANTYDYMQMVADLSARHLPAHAYTKEIAFAKIFGMTGIKINMSVMFDIDANLPNEYAGLQFVADENGNETYNGVKGYWDYLVGDKKRSDSVYEATGERPYVQSIGFDEAVALQNDPRYSKNCGIIGVGMSDRHILKMLDDGRIRYIIPYHSSSLPAVIAEVTNIKKATDYTTFQNTRKIVSVTDSNGNAIDIKALREQCNSWGEVYSMLQENVVLAGWNVQTESDDKLAGRGGFDIYKDLEETKNPKQSAENYLQYCAENNYMPVFEQFAFHENYYKLLYDFDPYDSVTGEYSPQTEVKNIYSGYNPAEGLMSTETVEKIINDEMAKQNEINKARNEVMPGVVDNVLEQLGVDHNEVGFSLYMEGQEPKRYKGISPLTDAYEAPIQEKVAPIQEGIAENATTNPTISKMEQVAVDQPEDIAPVVDTEEIPESAVPKGYVPMAEKADIDGARRKKITTVEERLTEQLGAVETELVNNRGLRKQSNSNFDAEIAKLKAEYDSKKNQNTKVANDILRRIERLQRMKSEVNAQYEKRISDLEQRAKKMKTPEYKTAAQRMAKQGEYTDLMEGLVGDTSTWVDKKMGLSYKVNTLKRNLRDIVRDANGNRDIAKADAIYDELQGKYNQHEASLNRESNQIKKPYANMEITKAEDAYIQMLGELRHNPDTTLTEKVVNEFYEKNKDNINVAKVDKAIEMARETYDSLLERVNEVLREQGMKEIPYRKGYFPHFTEEKQGFLAKLLNWKTQNNDIPTDIAGLTEQFNPNRSWQSFNKRRTGDTTDYSFTKGLDSYVHGALDWIYHIEDIQKRRALENHIRYIHSDKGVKEKIDAIRKNDNYDADEMQEQIDLVYKTAGNPLNNFVTDLRAGTNRLANKKSSMDRGMEEMTNRKIYSTMTNISNRVTANMVAGSVSSALTNFIPITQSWGEVSPLSSLRAMGDTIRSIVHDDGMVDKSDFLTNRLRKEENLYKTNWDKIGDKLGLLMEGIDNFTAQTVWRSKYQENISKGMSENEAIKNADQFAAGVMADRSRGNMPTIFDSKNPLIKTLTAFQLEVNNQYGYMFKDMPQDIGNESKAKLVKGYVGIFLGAYAYNALYSSLTGRDAAFDPINIVKELLEDLGLFGDDEEEETSDAFLNLGKNIAEEIPFVGGLLGGGRIPISSALPDWEGLWDAMTEEDKEMAAKKYLNALDGTFYYGIMPMGGGQLKKTIEGLSMFSDEHPIAGSYTESGKLRYAVEDTLGNRIQAGIFGQYANKNARRYFDEDRSPLTEKQTRQLANSGLSMDEYWDYQDGLRGLGTLAEKADYISELDLPMRTKNDFINYFTDRKEDIDLTNYDDYGSFEEFDYAEYDNPEMYSFLQENGVSYEEYDGFDKDTKRAWTWAFKNPEKYTVSKAVSDDFLAYYGYRKALNDLEADKDEDGNSISGSKKEKVIDYINDNLDNLDYGQKIILYRSMYNSREDRENYNNDIVDYLNGRDDISYEEMESILKELGFEVDAEGNISW